MKEDKIKIELSIKTEDEMTFINTSISINGLQINKYSDFTAFLLSSKDNRCWHTKKYLSNNRQFEYSHFYPFTCGCGVAGCIGIWSGISSKHRKHTVEWKIPKDCGYDFLDKTFYSFDKELYENELNRCWKFLEDNKDVLLTDEDSYSVDEEDNEVYLSELLKDKFSWLFKLKGKI